MHMRCNRIKQSLFKKPLFLSYWASVHSPFGVIGCPSQTEEGYSCDQSFLPLDLCNKPFKGVWWGLGTDCPSFTVKLKMRTLSNYEATFLQSVHIKNVPCPSARDRQINLRLQSHVREQVRAKLLKSARFSYSMYPKLPWNSRTHALTLTHTSTSVNTHKASYECSNILLPTCFSQFHTAPHTRTHTHTCVTTDSDVTFPFSKNTCSSVTTWGAEQADKSALHSNCLNRALHCCSFLWW